MDLLWRVGAFAEKNPSTAEAIGRQHALMARAMRAMYDSAGTAGEETFRHGGLPGECCGSTTMCAPGADDCGGNGSSCCAKDCCCTCRPDDDDFDVMFPEVDAQLDAAHVFQSAVLDILADDKVDDVEGAVEQAQELNAKGQLAAFYVPKAPARDLPDGTPSPKRCPCCGCTQCTACGCTCECSDGAAMIAESDEMKNAGGM